MRLRLFANGRCRAAGLCAVLGVVWLPVGSVQAAAKPTLVLDATPKSVTTGQQTRITWASLGASTCRPTGAWSVYGALPTTSGKSLAQGKPGAYQYVLTCTGNGGSVTKSVTVNVGATASLSVLLTAEPSTVGVGQQSTLSWSAPYAISCSATGGWTGLKGTSGSQAVTITKVGTTTFTLTCTSGLKKVSQSIGVGGVLPKVALQSFPTNVSVDDPLTFRWSSSYAVACQASGAWSGTLPLAGTRTFDELATGDLSYVLTCSNSGGSTSQTLHIQSNARPALPPAVAYQLNPAHTGAVKFASDLVFPSAPAWTTVLPDQLSYPLIADGLVFVTGVPGANGSSHLYALDLATGHVVWGPVTIPATYGYSAAAYDEGKVFVVNDAGLLQAFDARTGTSLWSVSVEGYRRNASPVAFGGLVFIHAGYGFMFAFDEQTGAQRWQSQGYAQGDGSPSVISSGAYFASACEASSNSPFDGVSAWQVRNGCSGGGDTVPVRDGLLYIRDFDVPTTFYMTELDAESGAVVPSSLVSSTPPAVGESSVFVVGSGALRARDIASSAIQWTFTGDGHVLTPAILINDRVAVSSSNGVVYVVDASTGLLIWSAIVAPDPYPSSYSPSAPAAGLGYLVVPMSGTLAAFRIVP